MAARQRLLNNDDSNPLVDDRDDDLPSWGSCLDTLGKCFGTWCMLPFPLGCCGACCNPYQVVNAGEQGVVVRFGRVNRVLAAGMHYINMCSEKLYPVDMRLHVHDLTSQEVITKDGVSVKIDGDVFYRRTDAVRATFYTTHLVSAVDRIAHTALRGVFGRHDLADCLAHRDQVAREIAEIVREQAAGWGVEITNIQVRDIKLYQHEQDGLASAARAAREARAKLITMQADVDAARLMHNAAEQLSSPAAMQIRMLETLEKLALSDNTKIVFIPTDPSHLSAAVNLSGGK